MISNRCARKSLVTNCNSIISKNYLRFLVDSNEPDQQVTVSNGKMKVEPIRLKAHFLWLDGIYAFENEPLINILEKMELYYDVKIVVKDTSLFKDTYTGKFRQRDSLDDVFRVLQQIRKFKVEKNTERNIVTLK